MTCGGIAEFLGLLALVRQLQSTMPKVGGAAWWFAPAAGAFQLAFSYDSGKNLFFDTTGLYAGTISSLSPVATEHVNRAVNQRGV